MGKTSIPATAGEGLILGRRAARAKGGGEVAAGVVAGRREVHQRQSSGGGEVVERPQSLLRAVEAECF